MDRLPGGDVLLLAAPLVAAVALAFASGGYFITSWGVAAIVLLALLAIRMAMGGVAVGGGPGVAALAGWGGLALWQGVSGAWADQPSAATAAMNQTLLYGAAFALVLVGVRAPRDLRWLLHGACLASAVVVAYALAGRLLPPLVGGDGGGRLAEPISYWNALGATAAFGAVLAVAGAGSPAHGRVTRAVHAAAIPMFLLALLLTFSRGALVALLAGLVLLVALAPARIETIVAAVIGLGVSIPLLLTANGDDDIATLNTHVPPPDDAGRPIALLLLVTMLAAGALVTLAALPLPRLGHRHRRVIGVGLAVAAVTVAGVVGLTRQPEGGAVDWADRQFESFKSYDTGARVGAETVAERLAVASGSGRWQNWGVAADQFRAEPVAGTGAGDYRFRWDRERDVDLYVRNAHSLYLEVLGESGVIGLLLLLTPIGAVVAAVALARRRGAPPEVLRDLGVALAAGAVLALHMAGDWDWQLPAVTLPAIVVGAGALKAAHLSARPSPASIHVAARAAIAVVAVAGVWCVTGPLASDVVVRDARDAAASGDLGTALSRAREAHDLNPRDPEPLRLQANVLADLGRPAASDAAFAAAVARSPQDWLTFADWADALRRRGDVAGARAAARRARTLNPREPRPRLIIEAIRTP